MELTREGKEHIARMVQSPGWRVFIAHVITPALKTATQHIDAPKGDEKQAQFYRGVKWAIKSLLEQAYATTTSTRNPFDEHEEAFLLDLNLPKPQNELPPEESPKDAPRPRRPAHPVI